MSEKVHTSIREAFQYLNMPFDVELAKSLGVSCSQLTRHKKRTMSKKWDGRYSVNAYEADIVREVFELHTETCKYVARVKAVQK